MVGITKMRLSAVAQGFAKDLGHPEVPMVGGFDGFRASKTEPTDGDMSAAV